MYHTPYVFSIREEENLMLKITKEEAMKIREELPWAHVTMTNKQKRSKARTYFCEETRPVKRLLYELQANKSVQHFE